MATVLNSRAEIQMPSSLYPYLFEYADLFGYLAATLTTSAFIPQAWLTWKTRSASGVSLGMYSVFVAGVALWLIYGFCLHSWPIVIANAITLSLASFILGMKIRFG